MAAPSYTQLLSTITAADSATGFTAIGGGGAITAETDFSIQNGTCVSKATAATWDTAGTARGGVLYNFGSGITVPTDGAVLFWMYWWGPGVLATKANGGAEINIGSATTAYKSWYVSGSDDWQFGGWRCYPVNPSVATSRANTGSPTATLQYFGWQANVAAANAIGKGNPYGIDAIRYGRCAIQVAYGSEADGYATFNGIAAFDNISTNRFGLVIYRDGAYYLQGLLQLGIPDALPPIATEFVDSNKVIFIQNTEQVTSNFNKIEVAADGSIVSWTNLTFTALGTVSRGNFSVSQNPTITITSCTFTDMGTFAFNPGATLTSSTFRRCNLISTGGATFSDCLFDRTNDSVKAVTVSSPASASLISNCTFISGGTKHGLEITGTAANVTLTGITWTGYAGTNGSTGNEAIYVNIASGSMTITVSGGNTPSVRTAGATVTVSSGATVTFTGLPVGCDVVILTAGTSTILQQTDAHSSSSYSWGYSGTPTVDVGFIIAGYVPYYIRNLALGTSNSSIPVSLTIDRNYQT